MPDFEQETAASLNDESHSSGRPMEVLHSLFFSALADHIGRQQRWKNMMVKFSTYLSVASVFLFFGGNAIAQGTQSCEGRELVQAGTFEAVAKSVGIIIGARWGGGTLTLDSGETHDFSFKGAKLLDFGASEANFKGTVYNLENIEDFPGTYLGVGTGMAVFTVGLGGVSMTNGKCVVLNAKRESAKGLQVTSPIGPGGVQVELDN